MSVPHVLVAIGAVDKVGGAEPARPRPLPRVDIHVVFELVLVGEALVACLARERKLRDV